MAINLPPFAKLATSLKSFSVSNQDFTVKNFLTLTKTKTQTTYTYIMLEIKEVSYPEPYVVLCSFISVILFCYCYLTVFALTVKIRKSKDFLAPISGNPADQIFSLTFRNSTSVFLNSHLWSKSAILKLNSTNSF